MGVWRGAQGPEEACVCEGRNSYTPVNAVRTTIVQQAIVRRGSLRWRRARTGSPDAIYRDRRQGLGYTQQNY